MFFFKNSTDEKFDLSEIANHEHGFCFSKFSHKSVKRLASSVKIEDDHVSYHESKFFSRARR